MSRIYISSANVCVFSLLKKKEEEEKGGTNHAAALLPYQKDVYNL
jgi:hypothetical protein